MSGPDKQAIEFTRLPAWTFLKVIGASADRLEVEFSGDGGSRQPGPGWVSVSDVQPSDPSGSWVRNHRASRLFVDSTGLAPLAAVPQWSWMVRLDDSSANGRLHVRVYGSAIASTLGEGWLDANAVGPTGPPAQSVWTGADQPGPPGFASHDQFVAAVADAARAAGTANAPVSVTVAQAILESNWGQSLLSREANNYFGSKQRANSVMTAPCGCPPSKLARLAEAQDSWAATVGLHEQRSDGGCGGHGRSRRHGDVRDERSEGLEHDGPAPMLLVGRNTMISTLDVQRLVIPMETDLGRIEIQVALKLGSASGRCAA